MAHPSSAFLEPGPRATAGSLAIVQLSRDQFVPIILEESSGAVDGYAEGAVLNTRFGSFPHSTFIGAPWGSQIRASTVDTGSRGRKRKRQQNDDDSKGSTPALEDQDSASTPAPAKKAVVASSGFVHILQPTPELWTQSLPHRTQVVYTPDYSYILQRIRARPGVQLIEAGAGSGSFTHASVRAVYSGYPEQEGDRRGKVFSFEFNEARYEKMQEELKIHRLEGLVQLTHRDAYNGGFLVDGKSPEAQSVFLDLPAPWEALPHLSRSKPTGKEFEEKFKDVQEWVSPLHPKKAAYLCTFSPCIEQVQRTITAMRQLGWLEIDVVEVSHKKMGVTREKPPSMVPAEKKAPPDPANVQEAVARLREIERRAQEHTALQVAQLHKLASDSPAQGSAMDIDESADSEAPKVQARNSSSGSGKTNEAETAKGWLQGRLVHRSEADLKMHTSYLVFAVLPCEWSEEDEAAAMTKWPCGAEAGVVGSMDKATRKREKQALLAAKKKQKKNGAKDTASGDRTPDVPQAA